MDIEKPIANRRKTGLIMRSYILKQISISSNRRFIIGKVSATQN